MTGDRFRTVDIAFHCRRPDPLTCYERLTSYGEAETSPCRYCPIASWNAALVCSGAWLSETDGLEEEVEPDALQQREKPKFSIQEAKLRVKAA